MIGGQYGMPGTKPKPSAYKASVSANRELAALFPALRGPARGWREGVDASFISAAETRVWTSAGWRKW